MRTPNYGNYAIFLIMGNAGFISSTHQPYVSIAKPKMPSGWFAVVFEALGVTLEPKPYPKLYVLNPKP